jgi:large subunit ribosomal protein L18
MSTKTQVKEASRARRHRRVRARINGTPERPRLNVYRSLTNIYAQIIDDVAGRTLVSASTVDKEIAGQVAGKKKAEAAEIVGRILAERAKGVGINQVVFDRGGYQYHGRVAALAKGARDGGLDF